jgi:hypothetical protein
MIHSCAVPAIFVMELTYILLTACKYTIIYSLYCLFSSLIVSIFHIADTPPKEVYNNTVQKQTKQFNQSKVKDVCTSIYNCITFYFFHVIPSDQIILAS